MKSINNDEETTDFRSHQHRLFHYISYELITVAVIVSSAYAINKLWFLCAVIGIGGILVFLNLVFSHRTKKLHVSSNLLILLVFSIITTTNYLVWGISTNYSYWFYIIPLLAAASLVRWVAMIVYSILAFLMIATFGILSIPPYYQLPAHLLHLIEWTNHLFAYLITVTIVIHLTLENTFYEKTLNIQNRLLANEKLKFQRLAYFDQLTNLPNRLFFKQNLQRILSSLKTKQFVSVLFMDLDNLKHINDYYGHEAGDELLIQAAKRIKEVLLESEFVARLGGDEFTAVAIHDPKSDIPEQMTKKLIKEFEKPFNINDTQCQCSISIGFSSYPKECQTIKDLMRKADRAMYAAKKKKRSTTL